jgi:hypothetical protein
MYQLDMDRFRNSKYLLDNSIPLDSQLFYSYQYYCNNNQLDMLNILMKHYMDCMFQLNMHFVMKLQL